MPNPHKTDQFFREGLDQLEITPSPASWNQVDARIRRTKSSRTWIISGIAASVALALVSGWIILNRAKTGNPELAGAVTHPVPLIARHTGIRIPGVPDQQKVAPQKVSLPPSRPHGRPPAKTVKGNVPTPDAAERTESMEPVALYNIASIDITFSAPRAAFQAANKELVLDEIKTWKPKVKITYIASKQTLSQDTTEINKLGRMWEYAQRVSPVELLAGLRDAKDQLLDLKRN